MSLSLNLGTEPDGLEVKTYGLGPISGRVYLGDYDISLEDFLTAAEYVLTNTDLEPNDPRLQFVKCVKSMKKVDGYNQNRERLKSFVPAVVLPTK